MVQRMLPDKEERLLRDSEQTLTFNVSAFRDLSERELRKAVHRTFADAKAIASDAGTKLAPTVDFRAFTNDMVGLLSKPEFGDAAIAPLLFVINEYWKRWRADDGTDIWRDAPEYPQYDISLHRSLYRYGNVELRVVEDYLLAPDDLRATMEKITEKCSSEEEMYRNASRSGTFINDDSDWNLRRLITNAGFYVGRDPDRAWETLKEWLDHYISALCNAHLAWSNTKAYYFLRIQRALNEKNGFVPRYVEALNTRKIYNNIVGKEILFVSPLAHIVNEQISSGHVWKLYRDFEVPSFSARAIPAWISTWPNRPHADWSETFARMCESVRAAHRERPFDLFIAACGCYGLPISEFARAEYGCSTLYVGHQAHRLFGILPVLSDRINREMWAESDLGKYENMDRIDNGRYLKAGR